MSDVSKDPDNNPPPPSKSAVVLLLKDIGDTTWRMFVPTIGLMSLGYWADSQLHTKPWLFVAGVSVGALVAGYLVRKQFTTQL